jgi:hypothetical protein
MANAREIVKTGLGKDAGCNYANHNADNGIVSLCRHSTLEVGVWSAGLLSFL